jgi:hypothetical protein
MANRPYLPWLGAEAVPGDLAKINRTREVWRASRMGRAARGETPGLLGRIAARLRRIRKQHAVL